MTETAFLGEQVRWHDLVRVRVIGRPRPQHLRAVVQEAYSTREFRLRPGEEFEFVGRSAAWAQHAPEPGDHVLLFLARIDGRWYQDPAGSDLTVREPDGTRLRYRAGHAAVTGSRQVPAALRESCRPDPERPGYVTFDRALTEAHLRSLIAEAGVPTAPWGRRRRFAEAVGRRWPVLKR
ncbi:hypothetical protein ACIA8O_11525 [Kitasatospora sp. NPDC051853]|uniref:hypothetical protein n=1 Tax=Kitasatospora sp. NPDC051853 TaxID=3364058 RepID=UPI003796BC13